MSLEYEVAFDQSELLVQQDEQQIKKQTLLKESRQIISRVDYKTDRGRQLLARSYRKINAMIDRLEKHQFKSFQDTQFLDDIVKSAFFYKPFDINNFNFKFQSSFCRDAVCGNRRLKMPVVKIGEQIVNQKTKTCTYNVDTSQFTLKIQSQPNSNIIWTNKPRSHPLLVPNTDPNNMQSFQKRFCTNQFVHTMDAPCELSIIAVSETKIESKVVTVNVTTNQNIGEYNTQHIGYAIRPSQTPFDQSSNNINSHSSMHSQIDIR